MIFKYDTPCQILCGILNLQQIQSAGFCIDKGIPTEQMLEKYPEHKDLLHKPDFLVVRDRKI